MSYLITDRLLEAFEDDSFQQYTHKLGVVQDWPADLEALAKRLHDAAQAANRAGVDKIPDTATHPLKRHAYRTHFGGTPPVEMRGLVHAVSITRLIECTPDNGKSVGNMAWFEKTTGQALVCCISSVLDLYDAGVLFTPSDEKHAQVVAEYGPLHLFPKRLEQLSQNFHRASVSARALGFEQLGYAPGVQFRAGSSSLGGMRAATAAADDDDE